MSGRKLPSELAKQSCSRYTIGKKEGKKKSAKCLAALPVSQLYNETPPISMENRKYSLQCISFLHNSNTLSVSVECRSTKDYEHSRPGASLPLVLKSAEDTDHNVMFKGARNVGIKAAGQSPGEQRSKSGRQQPQFPPGCYIRGAQSLPGFYAKPDKKRANEAGDVCKVDICPSRSRADHQLLPRRPSSCRMVMTSSH